DDDLEVEPIGPLFPPMPLPPGAVARLYNQKGKGASGTIWEGGVSSVYFTTDSQLLLVVNYNNIAVYNLAPKLVHRLNFRRLSNVALHPAGSRLFVADGHTVEVFDYERDRWRQKTLGSTFLTSGWHDQVLAVSPDGKLICGGAIKGPHEIQG